MKKLALLSAALLCSVLVFAQAKKAAAPAKKQEVKKPVYELTIISAQGPVGGEDPGLTDAIKQITEADLNRKVVFYNDAKGMAEYKDINMSFLPVYLLEKNGETSKKFEQFIQRGMLKENGAFIVFERQTRHGVFMDEPVQKNVLEVFVMSQCPYGAMAENKIIQAMKDNKISSDITIKLRFLAGEQGAGFRSLHGTAEWEEDVRQLLIQKYYPKKLWKYLEVRNKDYQSSLWPAALEEAGISVSKINKLFEKEGKQMLRDDVKYSNKFGVSGSPTYLWEGRILGDAEALSKIPGLEFLQNKPAFMPGMAVAPQPDPNGSC